ncbi:PucR family transcriptional regulator [Arthrobacter glacialis]|uniref:PucR family transcriptional regulator n=1 Tax=Arthrobacter glacialis TaxID=1664 RepID=A0A2S3ZZ11_ARTGL|nr:PucR family transcriptional regulator [Arthrobacter glacialis]POH56883.1 PucR family transcriptional regulator [Arthrobacter glacialis]POH74269.1 PucR family transcriptional regulator [Arthrobacter glacialis]
MALSLADLLGVPGLSLKNLGSVRTPLTAAIDWVAVTELENPQSFLSGGELVLTTGARQGTVDAQRSFVRQIKRAGAVGIGFGVGFEHAAVPAALLAEADRWAVPVVEVPYSTPFIAIGKLVADARSSDHYAKLERLLREHQVLARALLTGGGLPALLQKLSSMVAADLVITQFGGEVATTAPGAIPDDGAWHAVALSTGKRDSSTLWLRKPFHDDGIVDYARGLISIELNNLVQRRHTERQIAGQVIADISRGTLDAADSSARLENLGIATTAKNFVLLVRAEESQFTTLSTISLPIKLETAVAAVVRSEGSQELVLVVPAQAGDPTELGRALSHQMHNVGITAPVGIGGTYSQANGLRWSYFEAREAATRGLEVNAPERLSLTSLLLASEDVPMADMAAEALGPLTAFDASHGAELVDTLETYLRLNGSVAAVADALALHRNTVRYRLTQIAELTGYDPALTPDRVQLWLALAVRRLSPPA